MNKHICPRCGTSKCIDKKFVPYNLLYSVEGYKDCPKYYGPKPSPWDMRFQGLRKIDEVTFEENAQAREI